MEVFEAMHILDCTKQLHHYITHKILCPFYTIDKIKQVFSFAMLGNYMKNNLAIVDIVKLNNIWVVHLI